MKKRLSIFSLLTAYILTVSFFSGLSSPQLVDAALKTGDNLDRQARNACNNDSVGKTDSDECQRMYKEAYKTGSDKYPNGIGLCASQTIPNGFDGGTVRVERGPGCAPGVKLGVAAHKKDASNAEGNATKVCKANKNPGASQRAEAACREGYKAAADNKTQENACRKYEDNETKEACTSGYDAQKNGGTDPVLKTSSEYASSGDAKDEVDCDLQFSSPPSWFICPLIDLGVNMTDTVFQNIIKPMLENVPVSADPEKGVYIAWQQFRLIANVLLVGSLLVIVYSQARGGK